MSVVCLFEAGLAPLSPRAASCDRRASSWLLSPGGGIPEKRGMFCPQVLMIESFQNYFQIFKLEPIDEDIFIKADMQAYSNLCA